MSKKRYTSWMEIKKIKTIEFIEDPLTSMELFKCDFEYSYDAILQTLTAEPGYIDTTMEYYFEKHPLRKNLLVFRDDSKREEFYEVGIELDCVPSLISVCEGTHTD